VRVCACVCVSVSVYVQICIKINGHEQSSTHILVQYVCVRVRLISTGYTTDTDTHVCLRYSVFAQRIFAVDMNVRVTGCRRLIGSPKLQIIFHKRAT